MSRLKAAERKKLPSSDFALGKGHYPIEDEEHARKALQLGARYASPGELSEIKTKVHEKYPEIGEHKSAAMPGGKKRDKAKMIVRTSR